MYYLETENGKIIYKVKGLSHEIELTESDFKNLLFKQSTLQKFKTKWRKFLNEGHIKVLDQLYTLQVTDNKRKLIYYFLIVLFSHCVIFCFLIALFWG